MKFGLRCVAILLLVGVTGSLSVGQPLTFNNVDFLSEYDIHPDNGYMAFLYKEKSNHAGSTFNLCLVNDDFTIRDTVHFKFPRRAWLIGHGYTKKYYFYAFYEYDHGKTLQFLVTDHAGKLVARYSKSQDELKSIFKASIDLRLSRVEFYGSYIDSDVIVMNLGRVGRSLASRQGLFAMAISDGKSLWGTAVSLHSDLIEISDNRVIVMSYKEGFSPYRNYTVNIFDKENGRMIKSFPLLDGNEFQYIRVLKSNGSFFLLNGALYKNPRKHHRDFMEILDRDGDVLLNHVSDSISPKGLGLGVLVGTSQFDDQGDLLLTGVLREPINFDTAQFVKAGNFFGNPQNKRMLKETVLGLVSYNVSCDDGQVLDFNNYPPLLSYDNYRGALYDFRHALLLFGKTLWLYDLKNMVSKPVPFKLNSEQNAIFLNSSGPMGIFQDLLNNQIIFWRWKPEPALTN